MKLQRLACVTLIGVIMSMSDFKHGNTATPFQAQYEEIILNNRGSHAAQETKTGAVYHDAAGRVRTEEFSETTPGGLITIAEIYDPVAQMMYVLDTGSKIVLLKQSLPNDSSGFLALTVGSTSAYAIPIESPYIGEDLGHREIEGVLCHGHRINRSETNVIEYWYSDKLQEFLLLRSVDRNEEWTRRIFNIQFAEPDNILFTVPTTYEEISK